MCAPLHMHTQYFVFKGWPWGTCGRFLPSHEQAGGPNHQSRSCADRAWLHLGFLILKPHYITTDQILHGAEIDLCSKAAPTDAAHVILFKLEHHRKDKLL